MNDIGLDECCPDAYDEGVQEYTIDALHMETAVWTWDRVRQRVTCVFDGQVSTHRLSFHGLYETVSRMRNEAMQLIATLSKAHEAVRVCIMSVSLLVHKLCRYSDWEYLHRVQPTGRRSRRNRAPSSQTLLALTADTITAYTTLCKIGNGRVLTPVAEDVVPVEVKGWKSLLAMLILE
jgi:hypothetical protein